jgi:hypothetical protein
MNEPPFDRWMRALSDPASRRQTILASLLGGLALLRGGHEALAKKKRKKRRKRKKKKKITRNALGCVNVGNFCKNAGQGCSGLCEGKKGKKTCQAHNAGVCQADTDSCAAGVEVPCNPSNPSCFCTLTTGNAGFCAAFSGGPAGHCRVCRKDTDCEPEFGEGAACLVLGGICTSLCLATGRTACAPPCS